MPSEQERQSEIDHSGYPLVIISLERLSLLGLSEVSVEPACSCKIQHYSSCDLCTLSGWGTNRTVFLVNSCTRRETNVCLLVLAVVHVLSHKNKKGFNVVERSQAWVKGIWFLTSPLCATIWNSSSCITFVDWVLQIFVWKKVGKYNVSEVDNSLIICLPATLALKFCLS